MGLGEGVKGGIAPWQKLIEVAAGPCTGGVLGGGCGSFSDGLVSILILRRWDRYTRAARGVDERTLPRPSLILHFLTIIMQLLSKCVVVLFWPVWLVGGAFFVLFHSVTELD